MRIPSTTNTQIPFVHCFCAAALLPVAANSLRSVCRVHVILSKVDSATFIYHLKLFEKLFV